MVAAEHWIRALYQHLLKRNPGEAELAGWIGAAAGGLSDRELFHHFVASEEYQEKNRVQPAYPAGHYYSPVVDPSTLVGSSAPKRDLAPEDIHGIELSLPRMKEWWARNAEIIKSTPFLPHADGRLRYYSENGVFPFGDAVILRAMIREMRPHKIVEIGCGFSTACMLDTIEEYHLDTMLTLVEPYAQRLKERLRPGDDAIIKLIEAPVQDVALDEFRALDASDILFIDSTHVLKTGSDVHYELFSILPALKPGVLIHFHDVQYPFEYPDEWLFETKYSWNEIYALRAFLMYNEVYRVDFMNNMFHIMGQKEIKDTLPSFNLDPGASIWVRKIG